VLIQGSPVQHTVSPVEPAVVRVVQQPHHDAAVQHLYVCVSLNVCLCVRVCVCAYMYV